MFFHSVILVCIAKFSEKSKMFQRGTKSGTPRSMLQTARVARFYTRMDDLLPIYIKYVDQIYNLTPNHTYQMSYRVKCSMLLQETKMASFCGEARVSAHAENFGAVRHVGFKPFQSTESTVTKRGDMNIITLISDKTCKNSNLDLFQVSV